MIIDKRSITAFLIMNMIIVLPALSIKLEVSGDAGGFSEKFNSNINDAVTGKASISSEGISNSIAAKGDLEESHWVSNKDGVYAEVGVIIDGATGPYTYEYSLYPGAKGSKPAPFVSASESLNIPYADYIQAYAKSHNNEGYIAADSIEIISGTLIGYSNLAWASSDEVRATQNFDIASGSVNTDSGSFIWDSMKVPKGRAIGQWHDILPEIGISTSVEGKVIDYVDSAGKSTITSQTQQAGHIVGEFVSSAKVGTEVGKSRMSNYGDEYDLDMQVKAASSSPSLSGLLTYYATPEWTIQGAVNSAEPNDIIKIAPGIYKENVVVDKSLKLFGAGAGRYQWDDENQDYQFESNPSDDTIVKSPASTGRMNALEATPSLRIPNSGSIFTILPGNEVTLSNMVIKDGYDVTGGGIHNDGFLDIKDCTLIGNGADVGGAIFNNNRLILEDSRALMNSANTGGGAVYNTMSGLADVKSSLIKRNGANNGGGIQNDGEMSITGTEISQNSAIGNFPGCGGGIQNNGLIELISGIVSNNQAINGAGVHNGGEFNLRGGSISSNVAVPHPDPSGAFIPGYGGGIHNYGTLNQYGGSINNNIAYSAGGVNNQGIFNMFGGSVSYNKATDNNGGGIYNDGNEMYDSVINLYGGSIDHNEAEMFGGGIYSSWGGKVNILSIPGQYTGGTISNNEAKQSGGGIYNIYADIKMNSGSINHNAALYTGGGIFNEGGSIDLKGGSISYNDALSGAGIYNYGRTGLVNLDGGSISYNNANWGGGVCLWDGTLKLISGSIDHNSGGGVAIIFSGIVEGNRNIVRNNSPSDLPPNS